MLNFIALFPALYLMYYVYKMDRVDKEPAGLLIKVFLFGTLSTIPTILCSLLLEVVFSVIAEPGSTLFHFLDMFLAVALVEEYWKRWAAKRAWNHPAFNYRFDAIVYCVFAALGFAALENLLYVAEGGLSVALLRAVTAVPSHAIDGVLMGIFFGESKFREELGDRRGKKLFWNLSLIVPMFAHGFYDFCIAEEWSLLIFIAFVVGIDVWAIRYIQKASAEDELIDLPDDTNGFVS